MAKIIEVREGNQTLYVADYYRPGGPKAFFDRIGSGLTGGHPLTEEGSKTLTAGKHSVHLSPDRKNATQFGLGFGRVAKHLAEQITSAGRGSLKAEAVPSYDGMIIG